jgi:hypothetical protein
LKKGFFQPPAPNVDLELPRRRIVVRSRDNLEPPIGWEGERLRKPPVVAHRSHAVFPVAPLISTKKGFGMFPGNAFAFTL